MFTVYQYVKDWRVGDYWEKATEENVQDALKWQCRRNYVKQWYIVRNSDNVILAQSHRIIDDMRGKI